MDNRGSLEHSSRSSCTPPSSCSSSYVLCLAGFPLVCAPITCLMCKRAGLVQVLGRQVESLQVRRCQLCVIRGTFFCFVLRGCSFPFEWALCSSQAILFGFVLASIFAFKDIEAGAAAFGTLLYVGGGTAIGRSPYLTRYLAPHFCPSLMRHSLTL